MISSYLSCLRRYGLFKGRTNQLIFKEFLFCYLIIILLFFILWQMWDWGEFNFGNPLHLKDWENNKLLYGCCLFLLLHIPALFSASYRRLTDAGYKKNAFLLLLIPVLGWFSLLHLLLQPTHSKFLHKEQGLSGIQELHHPLNYSEHSLENSETNDRHKIKEIYNQELSDFSQTGKENMNSELYHSANNYSSNYSNNHSNSNLSKAPNNYAPKGNSEKIYHNSTVPATEQKPETQYKFSVLWSDFYLNSIEKYAVFKGKARRGEYFSFLFFLILFLPILIFLDGLLGLNFNSSNYFTFLNAPNFVSQDYNDLSLQQTIYNFYAGKMLIGYLSVSYLLLSITPLLALQSRRINDIGKKGVQYLWYFLLPILGWFILLILSLRKSKNSKA